MGAGQRPHDRRHHGVGLATNTQRAYLQFK
jgi:hypothetical protein